MSSFLREQFDVTARLRPVALVADAIVDEQYDVTPASAAAPTPHPAPYAAVEVDLGPVSEGRVEAHLSSPDGARIAAVLEGQSVGLEITAAGSHTRHRSRRHHRTRRTAQLALTLTGTHATAFTHEGRRGWQARARVQLDGLIDTRDPAVLGGLESGWDAARSVSVTGWRAGRFGQLGLRDIRLVSRPDGTPYRPDGEILLSATSAGPGFFDTAHTSLWRLDPDSLDLDHCSDLFFERADRPGVYGDHATHVLRDGDRWLVATSTWGDFVVPGMDRAGSGKPWVDVTLAETRDDLLTGQHVLATRPLPLPVDGLASVGTWDPHLVRDGDEWLVGFVSARAYFNFQPALATGPALDDLTLRAAATNRSATEGTTLLPTADGWQVLASDGPGNRRRIRRRYPVFDLDLHETGTVAAPYLSNIGWPTLVPPLGDEPWLMVTFDGTTCGGRLPGYGTHGDLVVLRAERNL